jgi:dTDP-4-amino-4,6-dideoxygalactose transaminase
MAHESVFTRDEMHRYSDADVEAVAQAMRGGSLSVVFGRQTLRFEREMAGFVGVDHAVATSSGTTALELALDLLDIGYGDEVVVPGYAFIALVSAVLRNLAVPVFADISADTWNVDARTVEAAITDRTRAVIVAHMFGNPAEVDQIRQVCQSRGIAVIEDCAQAAGATIEGRQVGSFGSAGCFSFNEIKNLTTGEGGLLALHDDDSARLGRVLRLHGTRDLVGVELAGKATMTEMEAALGRSQLARLGAENAQRTAFGRHLSARLEQIGGVRPQRVLPGAEHVYSRYVFVVDGEVITGGRDALSAAMSARGLVAKPVYDVPMYRQPVVTRLADGGASRGFARSYLAAYGRRSPLARWTHDRLPVVEEFCARQLGFVVPPRPTTEHADRIAEIIADAAGAVRTGVQVPA